MIKGRVITEFDTAYFIDYIKNTGVAYITMEMMGQVLHTYVYPTEDHPDYSYVISEDGFVIDSDSIDSFVEVYNDNN